MKRDGYSGIVYVEAEHPVGGASTPIEGHWEHDDRPDDGPGWRSAAEAIAWGRLRAPFVLLRVDLAVHTWRHVWIDGLWVRLRAPGQIRYVHYSAGEAHRDNKDWQRWPGASHEREAGAVDGYGGIVHLAQSSTSWHEGGCIGYTARWEQVRDGYLWPTEVVGPAWEDALDEAIAWGRERAPYVLVCEDVFGGGYESAGERDLPGLDLPRTPEDESWGEIPSGPFEVSFVVGEPIIPTSFPIPDGLEPAGGFPPADEDDSV